MICILLCAVTVLAPACAKRTEPQEIPIRYYEPELPVTLRSTDLMEGMTASEPVAYGVPEKTSLSAANAFGTALLKKCLEDGRNTLVSPLSVLMALGMTANGAGGETLRQMEEVFGLKIGEANKLLGALITALNEDEAGCLKAANSIWFKDRPDFVPNRDFLQKNADIFKASLYKAAFDNTTLEDINAWVCEHTKAMIKKILDEIPERAVMYLINAIVFEAEWEEPYEESAVSKGDFYNSDGTKTETEFMASQENEYFRTDIASGFRKYYKDRRYSLIALLPDKGHTVNEVVAGLDRLTDNMQEYRQFRSVDTFIPKFTADFEIELSGILKDMGMRDAFDAAGEADFKAMKEGLKEDPYLYIGLVIHKTHIEVDEKGTKAAAVTVVGMDNGCAMPIEEIPVVRLDRPFVYMLYDETTKMPFFIGVQNVMK